MATRQKQVAKTGVKILAGGPSARFPIDWVNGWRCGHGLTQSMAATKLGVPLDTFKNWDRRKSRPNTRERERILNITTSDVAIQDFQAKLEKALAQDSGKDPKLRDDNKIASALPEESQENTEAVASENSLTLPTNPTEKPVWDWDIENPWQVVTWGKLSDVKTLLGQDGSPQSARLALDRLTCAKLPDDVDDLYRVYEIYGAALQSIGYIPEKCWKDVEFLESYFSIPNPDYPEDWLDYVDFDSFVALEPWELDEGDQ